MSFRRASSNLGPKAIPKANSIVNIAKIGVAQSRCQNVIAKGAAVRPELFIYDSVCSHFRGEFFRSQSTFVGIWLARTKTRLRGCVLSGTVTLPRSYEKDCVAFGVLALRR